MKENYHKSLVKAAVKSFWEIKQKQLSASNESSNRGAVVGGKQLDAFAQLQLNRESLKRAYTQNRHICLGISVHPKTGIF